MSENNLKDASSPMLATGIDDLMSSLKENFATSAVKIYVNSLDKEITFREITVKEQKALTRTMSANERRKDVIYDAQCAMLNNACLTEGFDVRQVSEFDRLKLMLALYQSNMSTNEVKFICDECGAENKYQIDFNNAIHRLDSFDLTEKNFHYENKKFRYEFVVKYPSVKTVSKFHESYCRVHSGKVPRREIKSDENLLNMEYVNLFIQSVVFTNKETDKITEVDFSKYAVSDYETILSIFPLDVLYSEDGVIKYIVKELIQPVNDAFDKHECYNCHTVHEKENANQAESFF